MRTYPRIRKTVKWGGAVVCALLLVVWLASVWWFCILGTRAGQSLVVSEGALTVRSMEGVHFQSAIVVWKVQTTPVELSWWYQRHESSIGWWIHIPLWFFFAPGILATAAAWRLDTLARRRARVGLCLTCRYDRAGLAPGAVCPECGTLGKS